MNRDSSKIPQHSLEAERSVLGCCLLDKYALMYIVSTIKPIDFFHPPHKHIYQAFNDLVQDGLRPDYVTLTNQLVESGHLNDAGGPDYIAGLTNVVPTIRNATHYSNILIDKSQLRLLERLGKEMAAFAGQGERPQGEILNWASGVLLNISERSLRDNEIKNTDELLDECEEYSRQIQSGERDKPLAFGFPSIDKLLTPMGGNMIVVAARTNIGKTAFGVQIALNLARVGKKTLFMSAEMSKMEMMQRLIANHAEIPLPILRNATAQGLETNNRVQQLREYKDLIKIVYGSRLTELDISNLARQETLKYGKPDLIIVDYLQRLTFSRPTMKRNVEVASLSRAIKGVSGEVDIPIILLSQITRPQQKDRKKNDPPTMFDIKESGDVENDADAVAVLHRLDMDDGKDEYDTDFILHKNRHGPKGRADLVFTARSTRFRELMGREPHKAAQAPVAEKVPDDTGGTQQTLPGADTEASSDSETQGELT